MDARSFTLSASATLFVERTPASLAKSSLTERREEYVEKRDDAKLSTTKAIYQTFIDIIDAIIAKMDEEEATDESDSAVGE